MNFRQDINGLRALAVIGVLVFHFSPNILSGGFAGVDVFFVISGYLMTSIIFRGFYNNNFSFFDFIKKRAIRIVPALAVIIALSLLIGYLTIGPDGYRLLGKHARDSLLFISNITYEKENGYFDVASNNKFLLHTWSLSVEWQFYIFYPLLLLVFKKFLSVNGIKKALLWLTLLLFFLSLYLTYKDPISGYFKFYTRSWEMLVGGLLFLYPLAFLKQSYKVLLEVLGVLIIILSFIIIDSSDLWPSYLTLLPILGTAFCIAANNPSTFFSLTPINKLGLWSYSIYLVHWPILVLDGLFDWQLSFFVYLFITISLSICLYYGVEKFRIHGWKLLVLYLIVLLGAIYARETSGNERFDIPLETKQSFAHGHQGWKPFEWRIFDKDNRYKTELDYVFYGDSYSAQLTSYLTQQDHVIATLYDGACLSTPNYYSDSNDCIDLYSKLKKEMAETPSKNLVIIVYWSLVIEHLKSRENHQLMNYTQDEFLEKFEKELLLMKQQLNIENIVLIGSHNGFIGPTPQECLSQKYIKAFYEKLFYKTQCEDFALRQYTDAIELFNQKLSKLASSKQWLKFINPNEALCDKDKCIQVDNNLSLYSDKNHLSELGSKKVGEYIIKQLDSF